MSGYVGRLGSQDLNQELKDKIQQALDGDGGNGSNQMRVYVSETKPSNLPVGSLWIEAPGFVLDDSRTNTLIFSKTKPENLAVGDVWVELLEV